ncbi:hypothetical protein ACJMK2_011754 [Sinanodonta woodiana]|uniref:Heat shock 70 kDa protein 12A n=1 Tax=Sinanodonta woodiana TaxID=1069815 RepID=A0ABD3V8C3_SINWO
MEPEIVIALDIGSTYSGYAYQFSSNFKENPSAIRMSDSWGSSNKTHKTSTCLLLKCDTLERIAIGEDAEREYLRLCDIGTECEYHFFKYFKMILYRKDFSTDENSANLKNQDGDYSGRHKPFTLVMSKFIEGLKEDCLEKFERYDGKQKDQTTDAEWNSVIDEKKIRWVITVPAIWNDFAKHAMRESAVMAGIPDDQLIIALEPEAAVVHCMYLSDQEKKYMGELGSVGSKFIVVDMGGGTVDITAVKVLENGHLEQIMKDNGGPWGGQSVNDSFSQLVRDVFITKDGHSSFESCTRADLFEMELEFERQKVAIRGKKKHVKSWIKLPLPDEVWSKVKDNIITNENHKYSRYFDKTKNGLNFKLEIISEILFNEPMALILDNLQSILNAETIRSIEKVVLVGGLAESHIVQEKISEALPHRHILVPSDPFCSVLQGAVIYGQKPDIFESRISRFTYGIDTHIPFDPKKHPQEKKKEDSSGKMWCKDVFDIHVKSNQTVSLNEEQPAKVYEPLERYQRSIRCNIFQTVSLNPVYVTEKGCKKIGSLVVEMPDLTEGIERNALVTMIYGGTELRVKGIDVATGKEFKTSIVYD